jgi:transposase
MVRLVGRVIGVGIETADMLVREVLSRNLRDRRAAARYAGLTGAPDESGSKRRDKGLARAGDARVRRGMIQLAWRFLMFQKERALAQWYRARTADCRQGTRKSLIVAMAQAADRIMAFRDDRPSAGWRGDAAGLSRREHNSFGAWRLEVAGIR